MKHISSILKMFSIGVLLVGGTACTDNFADINRKDYDVDSEELGRENYNLGSTLKGLQGLVVPTKEHMYQFIEALAAGPYAGYYAAINPWTTKFETYNPSVDWQNKTYADVFTETYPLYRDLQDQSDDPVALALAKLLRVAIMHRVTDMYGPIPYSQILDEQGGVQLATAYDSQEAVYTQMLKELDEAGAVLKENSGLSTEMFRKFDDVYFGNIGKWYKYLNSLKLRMALRMSYVNPTLAQQTAEQAVLAGVITENADNAFLTVEENRAAMMFNDWNDHRVGADIICYMNGYQDPRREKMFTKVDLKEGNQTVSGYAGVRIGIDVADKDVLVKPVEVYSKPLTSVSSPYQWMNAAEVTFLRAEGALRGWNMGGEAKELYERGVNLSFEQYGVSDADYLTDAERHPQAYNDPKLGHSNTAMSSITIPWQDGAEHFEENLERIITQKWIAMFPNTVEAWSEQRRTDYPKLMPVVENKSGGVIDDAVLKIRRLWYPPVEYTNNRAYLQDAINNQLGGPDNGATKLWWDKKPR